MSIESEKTSAMVQAMITVKEKVQTLERDNYNLKQELKEAHEALKFYLLGGREKYGQLFNLAPSAQDKKQMVYAQVYIGSEALAFFQKYPEKKVGE